jgi:hypothetical protein
MEVSAIHLNTSLLSVTLTALGNSNLFLVKLNLFSVIYFLVRTWRGHKDCGVYKDIYWNFEFVLVTLLLITFNLFLAANN